MRKKLEEFFGSAVNIKKYSRKLSLPLYMTMRNISIVELYGTSFALVDIKGESDLSASAMKKQIKLYQEALMCPVAYEVNLDSISARNAMVKNDIAFIDLPQNVFLPFLAVILQGVYKKKLVPADRMMPATQMVFLELLYMDDGASALKSEIAGRLKLTKTSVTRATAQLKAMELITESKSGTEISIMRNYPKKEYFLRGKQYLINPVQKVFMLKSKGVNGKGVQAGESALSNCTQLNPPAIPEIAIFKGKVAVDQSEIVDPRFEGKGKCVKLQLWKYDPAFFARGGAVDPVSLACTFQENEDERIEMCIQELLEEI